MKFRFTFKVYEILQNFPDSMYELSSELLVFMCLNKAETQKNIKCFE